MLYFLTLLKFLNLKLKEKNRLLAESFLGLFPIYYRSLIAKWVSDMRSQS
jgi:hypothetical protein